MEVSQLCSTSVLRDELRGRVSRKALRILEVSSQNREYSQKHIAESVKCSVRYVRKVLSGHAKQAAQAAEKGAASNRKWYEIIANNHLASVCAAIFASESTANSTDLLNPSKFRDLTEVRLVRHSDRESPTDKDEYTAVDLCSSDFIPLASWGQLGEKGPVFACIQERFLQADLKNACCVSSHAHSMWFNVRWLSTT